ncbi:hypothetical protein F0919_00770 [Taibaiella lutea]|uniref:DUF4935 domain-containing protein n=1 Tax=Taibaiella lutea TaxID=2608001 RepID=A0A5M6CLX6_9BACT|nr:PIN domain-containing protein [Taibaiella lutea]KAA5536231.1 hypothetical protein F0919_00770 [Taibaiella lutea]
MEHVFLDTSVFIKENYLEGTRIKELLRLSKELFLKIVVPEIVIAEVKNNFKKSLQEVNDKIGILKKGEGKYLKNLPLYFDSLKDYNLFQVCTEFDEKFDIALVEAKAIIIPYKLMNVQPVFEKYFNGDYPFKGKNKKVEFPDAIILQMLEEWCIETKTECTIFSMDHDLQNYKHGTFKTVNSYEDYLSSKLKDIHQYRNRIDFLAKLYLTAKENWSVRILDWVEAQLEDTSNLYGVVNGFDIYDVDGITTALLDSTYEVIAVDDESITIEVNALVEYKVDILIDDENSMFYDSDDKSYHYFEQSYYEYSDQDLIETIFKVHLINEEDYDENFELIQINNDKNLALYSKWE